MLRDHLWPLALRLASMVSEPDSAACESSSDTSDESSSAELFPDPTQQSSSDTSGESSLASGLASPDSELAARFGDGTLLEFLSVDHLAVLTPPGRSAYGLAATGVAVTLTWGTICSGSEVMLLVLMALASAYAARGVSLKFKHAFSCEIVPCKQTWIRSLFRELAVEEGCLFSRAEQMGGTKAYCVRHAKECVIPCVDLLVTGTSCKDFSKASRAHQKPGVLNSKASLGGSAQTFWGVMSYLQAHVVSMLLFENVDTLDENASPDCERSYLETIRTYLHEVGMSSMSILTDCQLFALPQERRRYYILALRNAAATHFDFGLRPCKAVFQVCIDNLKQCQKTPPCLSEVFLKDDHAAVEKQLNFRTAQGSENTQYNVAASISAFRAQGLAWGTMLPEDSGLAQSPWYPTLSSRQRSALQFSQNERPGDTMCRDISQSLQRIRYSKKVDERHVAMCQIPEQLVWLEVPGHHPRLQLAIESLMLQGFPLQKVPTLCEKTSEHTMAALAGNMMAATVPLAIIASLFESVTWRVDSSQETPHAVSRNDVNDALSCFNIITAPVEDEEAVHVAPGVKRQRLFSKPCSNGF